MAAAAASTRRPLKWALLVILIMTTFFLASFNATLRYIVDQRTELHEVNVMEASKKVAEKKAWEDASSSAKASSSGSGSSGNKGHWNKVKEAAMSNDGGKGTSLEEEMQRQHVQQGEEHAFQAKLALQKERDNPTFDKFKTTRRPLDGFGGPFDDRKDGVQSFSRQARAQDAPRGESSSAHYAKALRMLSTNFDQLKNSGNALPHPVHSGDYDQEIHKLEGRGDRFVKMDLPTTATVSQKNRKRSKSEGRRRRKRVENEVRESRRRQVFDGFYNNEDIDEDDELDYVLYVVEVIQNYINDWKDYVNEWLEDVLDYMHDIVGVELVEYQNGGDNEHQSGINDEQSDEIYSHGVHYEEDVLSWRETRVGSQLLWMYGKIGSLWSRGLNMNSKGAQPSSSSSDKRKRSLDDTNNNNTTLVLSKQDELAREGLFHLEKAAELGHAEAQRMVANSLASGILPISDHGLMHRLAKWQYHQSQSSQGNDSNDSNDNDSKHGNWTSILLQSTLQVPNDFSTNSQQLSRAILLYHLSAMDGNVESAMSLGYRHLYSAVGGALIGHLADDKSLSTGYHPVHGGVIGGGHGVGDAGGGGAGGATGGGGSSSHYGVLGTCPTAMAYYEAAAHGIMDELEGGPTKGKVNPPIDEHRLAEIYTHGGASVALDANNKPDELEEALQYYRMLASRSHSPEPQLDAAFTIANFYYNGYRGAKQDLRLAVKYYEICGDYNHWEGGGQAGLMHVWGIGMLPEERDLGKAYSYFAQGTPGGIDSCMERLRRKKRQNNKNNGAASEDGEVVLCDRHSVNGMGLLNLLGVEGLIDRDVNMARRWFEHGKDFGDAESSYNYAMMRLGWMVTEIEDVSHNAAEFLSSKSSESTATYGKQKTAFDTNYMSHRTTPADTTAIDEYAGPTASDYSAAIQEFGRASAKGHLQAKHKLGMLYAAGASIPNKGNRPTKAVAQSCINALRFYKSLVDVGHTISRRNRAAWKQYNAGDYESALRNYLSSAETGNEIGQVNAAFLLEQGYCLGMTTKACTHASIRFWRAAARQGNLEACLRVGDFYYYGRMKESRGLRGSKDSHVLPSSVKNDGETSTLYDREEYLSSLEAKAFYFIPGPYRWTRYVLYPEELFDLTRKWVSRSVHNLGHYLSSAKVSDAASDEVKTEIETPSPQSTCSDEAEGTCAAELDQNAENDDTIDDEEEYDHMAIAAQYYRKAAEEHKSARANFNLGFMHEWGLGLTQDFPLAKRHYDLAGGNDSSNMASVIALYAMDIHQNAVKFGMYLKEYARNYDLIAEDEILSSDEPLPAVDDDVENPSPPKPDDTATEMSRMTKEATEGAREIVKTTYSADTGESKTKTTGIYIPMEDVINDMYSSPNTSIKGHFPDLFEQGFEQLPWKTNLWKIIETDTEAPLKVARSMHDAGRYSAFISESDVSNDIRATLTLNVFSLNGGRICFYLFADVALPWLDFRFSVDSVNSFMFAQGTSKFPGIWVDVCFDIPPEKHTLEWSLAWPGYYEKAFKEDELAKHIEMTRHSPETPSGRVLLDNVRFFPFVYENFETGDFTLQKWRQNGDGAPWRISEENALGQYSAYAGPTSENPSGVSNLQLSVDLGYTGAMITFYVKTRTGERGHAGMLWFYIDGHKVRPWFGDNDKFQSYTHYINEGVHKLQWSFECKGDDPEAGAWLDE